MSGLITEDMKVSGSTIKCTAREYSHGLTEENMKVTTLMTKKKVVVFSYGQMEESTMESGSTESNTVSESITLQRVKLRKENGKKARESDGSLMNECYIALNNFSFILCAIITIKFILF